MIYRKEIDGLRALAVIPVVLFHAGFEWVSGGYVGVDVFFVISGYLITSILLGELQSGSFSIRNFYERRARRILPALFLVLLFCLPFAWLWLLPEELEAFARSLIAVIAFVSNILFWQETDYFTASTDLIPLLHTWSLAVEEQFYIFFPLFLAIFWKAGRRILLAVIAVVALVSLGLTEWGWRYYPEANFYLIFTRAWELMIGAFVAFYLFYKEQPHGQFNEIVSFIGLAMIVSSLFFLDKSLPFPSVYALIPTVGTALVILFATTNTLVNKLLSLKPFVAIGLISYSAYLWHQPLFVFARAYYMDEPNRLIMSALSIGALFLAYLSWRFVEKPFRNKQRFSQKQIFVSAFVVSLLFIAVGVFLIISEGAMYRFA
ncbi:MAG: acyltransferase [Aquificaceae bacterium]|nr:MAG: acyltransferase [Aquificaceae bacterium]